MGRSVWGCASVSRKRSTILEVEMRKMIAGSLAAMVVTVFAYAGMAQPTRCHRVDIEAGPIWDNGDARVKCPAVCSRHGGMWKGDWTTTVAGQMSVCGCYICP